MEGNVEILDLHLERIPITWFTSLYLDAFVDLIARILKDMDGTPPEPSLSNCLSKLVNLLCAFMAKSGKSPCSSKSVYFPGILSNSIRKQMNSIVKHLMDCLETFRETEELFIAIIRLAVLSHAKNSLIDVGLPLSSPLTTHIGLLVFSDS